MIFEINFFLFSFAQSGIWSYTCVYAKLYANITNQQFSALAMSLPVLALFAKPVACSLTDAHGIHKQFLIGSIALFGLSYGSLGILPFFKDPNDHDSDSITWFIIIIIMSVGHVATACVFCMNDALASNHARKHNKSYSIMRIYANSGWAAGALLMMLIGDISWLPSRVFGCILLFAFAVLDIIVLLLWPYLDDFEMFHDGSTIEQRKLSIVGPNTMALLRQNKPRGSISRDMLERIRAGRSKSVGGVPRVEEHFASKVVPEKEPKEYSNFQCQMILMKMIASKHKSFVRYIGLFTLFGIVQGMIWNYQLDYIQVRVARDKEEFEFMSTLCMIAQSLLGEIPINFIAMEMIRLFGANANLSLALVCLGLRCFFYSNLLPYLSSHSYIVIAEAFQGPTLGLYWVLTVEIGSNYALMVTDFMPEMKRKGIVRDRVHEEELSGCLRATMIGVMSSSMEGLGSALGAFLGGWISASSDYGTMWNSCTVACVVVGFGNIGWDMVTKLLLRKEKDKKLIENNIPVVIVEDFEKTNNETKL